MKVEKDQMEKLEGEEMESNLEFENSFVVLRELKNLEKKSVHFQTSNEGNFTALLLKMFFT